MKNKMEGRLNTEKPRTKVRRTGGLGISTYQRKANGVFETMRWLKRQNGKRDVEKKEHKAETVLIKKNSKTAETDGTTIGTGFMGT